MKKRISHPRVSRAFTLIELLVVIAIIAILAAILFPVFAQAREKARAITCVSNQKQIALGFMMYIEDYDETFPQGQYLWNTANTPQFTWADVVYPYTKQGSTWTDASGNTHHSAEGGVYRCPSFPSNQAFELSPSYDAAPDGSAPWNGWTSQAPPSLAEIQLPAQKIYLVEKGQNNESSGWLVWTPWEWDWTDWIGGDPPTNPSPKHLDLDQSLNHDCDLPITSPNTWSSWAQCGMLPRYRHTKSTNVAFFDGHVKSMAHGSIDWYKNVFQCIGYAKDWCGQGWYPY